MRLKHSQITEMWSFIALHSRYICASFTRNYYCMTPAPRTIRLEFRLPDVIQGFDYVSCICDNHAKLLFHGLVVNFNVVIFFHRNLVCLRGTHKVSCAIFMAVKVHFIYLFNRYNLIIRGPTREITKLFHSRARLNRYYTGLRFAVFS